jgi:hypothetical protein
MPPKEVLKPPIVAGHAGSIEHVLIVLLVVLSAALLASNNWFPAVDDECAIINRAAKPFSQTIQLYVRGLGEHEHPPLYDIILHGWLRLTGGEMHLLRIPAIVFFALGTWILAKAAKSLGGRRSQTWVVFLVVLWPFGFHFGRLAAWYSFCFFLVSLLTYTYFKYVDQRTLLNWTYVFLSALALVNSNYFGWAFIACLGLDFANRERRDLVTSWRPLLGMGVLLFTANLPLLGVFLREIHHGIRPNHSVVATVFLGIYNLYCMFVSESVAPWFWLLGVPAGVAIAVCLLLVFLHAPARARHFLLYFAFLLVAMTFLGIATTKRTLPITAWLILPIGSTLGTLTQRPARRTLLASLALVAFTGWYGILSRDLYAARHWIEPWKAVARRAADVVQEGGTVIGNNPSFFFYLTYAFPTGNCARGSFVGLLPDSVRRSGVYDPQQWIEDGRHTGSTTLFVKGLDYGVSTAPTEETELWLNQHCNLLDSQQMVHDPGAGWKQRFAPTTRQPEWRVEVREYGCQ